MKIASLQYRYDFPKDFSAYRAKVTNIVKEHAEKGTETLPFKRSAKRKKLQRKWCFG